MTTNARTDGARTLCHRLTSVRSVKNGLVITGTAFRPGGAGERLGFQAELRHADGTRRYLLPASRVASPDLTDGGSAVPQAGFEVLIDPGQVADGTPLAEGRWSLWLTCHVGSEDVTVRLGADRDPSVPTAPQEHVIKAGDRRLTVLSCFSEDEGFVLDAGRVAHRPEAAFDGRIKAQWEGDDSPVIRLEAQGLADGTVVFEATGPGGLRQEVRAKVRHGEASGVLSPRIPGQWAFSVRLSAEGAAIPVPAQSRLGDVKWWQGLHRRYAKPLPKQKDLVVVVGTVDVLKGAARRVRG